MINGTITREKCLEHIPVKTYERERMRRKFKKMPNHCC